MKKSFLLLAVLAATLSASAQRTPAKNFTASVGPRLGVTVGDLDRFYNAVLGVDLQGEHMFASKASATLSTGYTHFLGDKDLDVDGAGIVPVMAGLRYYPSTQFFLGARLGYGFFTDGGSNFVYEPQIGYNGRKVQVGLGYQSYPNDGSSLAHIGLIALIKLN